MVNSGYCFTLAGNHFCDRNGCLDSVAAIEVLLLPSGHGCTADMGCF